MRQVEFNSRYPVSSGAKGDSTGVVSASTSAVGAVVAAPRPATRFRQRRRTTLGSMVRRIRWWAHPRRWLRTILNMQDSAHSIALGTAIGVFIGMTPTVGIQMVLVVILALLTRRLFHFNRPAALLAVYISNPITTVPIYWLDYQMGTLFLPGTVTQEHFERLLRPDSVVHCWVMMTDLLVEVGAPLVLGSLLTGAILAAMTYPTMLYFVRLVRQTTRRSKAANPRPS